MNKKHNVIKLPNNNCLTPILFILQIGVPYHCTKHAFNSAVSIGCRQPPIKNAERKIEVLLSLIPTSDGVVILYMNLL